MKRLLLYVLMWSGFASAEAGRFTVVSTADSGAGTLRQAILGANTTPGGPHLIAFAITTTNKTISPYSALPAITNSLTIDGFTQAGSSPNTLEAGDNAKTLVRIDGSFMAAGSDLLRFSCDSNVVRGLSLTRNRGAAIHFTNSNHNVVVGNRIGATETGQAAGGAGNEIYIEDSNDNRIGGPAPSERNSISQSANNGIVIVGAGAFSNRVLNCYVGLDPTGQLPRGSYGSGILISNAANNVIGPGNYVSNNGYGIQISGSGATNNLVKGNRIGLYANGSSGGNGGDGVAINQGASMNQFGGVGFGDGNTIAWNGASGVLLQSGTNNAIRGNSIYYNRNSGIAFESEVIGPIPNDRGDADTGPNQKQNFPVITSATIATSSTRVAGTLNSVPLRNYSLDFFASADPEEWFWPYWEGQYYLGTVSATTGPDGNATFDVTLPMEPPARWITATATSPEGNTSQFSDAFGAVSDLPTNVYVVTNTNDTGAGSLRNILTVNNISTNSMPNRIEFHIPGSGPFVINVLSPLPAVTQPVVVDGYTQTEAKENTLTNGDNAVIPVRLNATFGLETNGTIRPILSFASLGCVVRGLEFTGATSHGVRIERPGNCIVEGCFFGPVGDDTPASIGSGIAIDVEYSSHNLIGGTTPAARNVIGGFGLGIEITAPDQRIVGNFIGTDHTGATARPNGEGISGWQGGAVIGGPTAAERNVISGNKGSGISLLGGSCQILGNFIGLDVSGEKPLGNRGPGIYFGSFAGDCQVGGIGPGEGNMIAYNSGSGIDADGGWQLTFRGNQIFQNVGLGIDLGSVPGVTLNDDKDADKGGNDLQNFPILSAVTVDGASLRIEGSLNSVPNSDFTIDFYSNRTEDASGYGQGEQYIGATTVSTDTNGNSAFLAVFPAPLRLGRYITATATDGAGNTSEFSAIASLPAADTDGDGLDDNWERQYFGDLSHEGSGDSDLDGMTDRDEFIAGTNPTAANSALRFVANPIRTSTTATLKFQSVPGRRYRVQYKESLNATAWSDVPGEITANGPTISLTDIPLEIISRFYRVLVLP